jgi:hypothetical protein
MAIERLKSGRYRIRFEKDKKKHSITTDKKPNKREEAFLIQQYLDSLNRKRKKGTFQEYAIEYIESKENVLSASTIKGYRNALKAIPISFLSIQLFSIEQHDITKLINSMVSEFKPKTIHNRHGFISAVIKEFRPDFILTTKLPRKEQKDIYTPSETEVMQIFKYLKESPRLSRHYIPVYLGAMGLRRSEIGALCLSDLSDDNYISITKAKVLNSKNEWIIQNYTKTERSNRKIPIPKGLADEIRKQGYVYKGSLNQIFCALDSAQKALDLPHFGIHRLRSYFASKAHALGIPDSVILTLGGWKSDNIMKGIYRKALTEDLENASEKYLNHFNNNQ